MKRPRINKSTAPPNTVRGTSSDNPWHGVPVGRNDVKGRPVHYGDVLDFDEKEWGAPCRFTIEFRKGETDMYGSPGDIPNFCTIHEKWDKSTPVAPPAPPSLSLEERVTRLEALATPVVEPVDGPCPVSGCVLLAGHSGGYLPSPPLLQNELEALFARLTRARNRSKHHE